MNYQEFSDRIVANGLTVTKSPATSLGDPGKTMKVMMTVRRKRGNAKVAECFYTYPFADSKSLTWYDGFFAVKTPGSLIQLFEEIK